MDKSSSFIRGYEENAKRERHKYAVLNKSWKQHSTKP